MPAAFVDTFSTLNARWTAQNGPGRTGTGDAECYRPSQVSVGGSGLTLTAASGSPDPSFTYTSGEIDTGYLFTYGTFTARCKMPATPAAGMWPAFWLVNNHSVNPPQEIDIFEWFGATPNQIKCNYIWSYTDNAKQTNTVYDASVDLSAAFHDYTLSWTPTALIWKFDTTTVKTWTSADAATAGTPFPTDPMHLIFNLGVGGASSVGGTTNGSTVLPGVFQCAQATYTPNGTARVFTLAGQNYRA